MKRIFAVFTCVLIICSFLLPSEANVNKTFDVNSNVISSVAYADILTAQFKQKDASSFGGVFLDDQGRLNVCITESNYAAEKNSIESILKNTVLSASQKTANSLPLSKLVIYHKVKYSESYLKSLQEALREKISDFSIVEQGVRISKNKLEIVISDINKTSEILSYLSVVFSNFDEDALEITAATNNIILANQTFSKVITHTKSVSSTYDIFGGESLSYKAREAGTVGFIAKKFLRILTG